MIPRILDYVDGQVVVTVEARMIPELNALIKKYGDDGCLPYMNYVAGLTHPESAYINLSEDEAKENVIYDTIHTLGDFNVDEPLLKPAVTRLRQVFYTRTKRYYEGICKLMDKAIIYSENAEVTDENLADINKMLKEVGATMRSFKDAEKQIDDELKTKMKGKSVLGDY